MIFGRKRPAVGEPAEPDRHCSFCKKRADEVRKLIAGPTVHICDECVDVCVDILADDRRASASSPEASTDTPGAPEPSTDVRCTHCLAVTSLEHALVIESPALLCPQCVRRIAQGSSPGPGDKGGDT